jgi:hypothetical protein
VITHKTQKLKRLQTHKRHNQRFLQIRPRSIRIKKNSTAPQPNPYTKIYLRILLTTIVVQTGFKTKTQRQQLTEGKKIEFQPPKIKNKKNKKNTQETKEKSKNPLQSRTTRTINRRKTNPDNARFFQ